MLGVLPENTDGENNIEEIELIPLPDESPQGEAEYEEKLIPDNETVISQIIEMGNEAETSYKSILALADAFDPSIQKAKDLYEEKDFDLLTL